MALIELSVLDMFCLADAVWTGSTVPGAFEECGFDYVATWPFIDPAFGSYLLEVDMMSRALLNGSGVVPGKRPGEFVS